MQFHNKILLDNIEREKKGIDYCYPASDKKLLQSMYAEIKQYTGVTIHYLAELDALVVPGAGRIIARYIQDFSSEAVKGYLLPQLIADKFEDCDKLVLSLYMHFRQSSAYIAAPGKPAPAHIYVRYDNAFKALKPKRLYKDLVFLAHHPRDAFYLPFTMRMLASWRISELENTFVLYSSGQNISEQDVGIVHNSEKYFPSFSFIIRELRFTGIDCLKYYPTARVINIIQEYTTDENADIRCTAKKTLQKLKKANSRDDETVLSSP